VIALLRATEGLSATCVSHAWGTVVRDGAVPHVHDANHAFVYDVHTPSLDELCTAMREAQQSVPVDYIQVEVLDSNDRPQLMADLTAWLGPPGDRFVLMATNQPAPPQAPPAAHVTEGAFPDAETWLALIRTGHCDAEDFPWEVAGEFVDRDIALAERATVRFFAAESRGDVAAYASLLSIAGAGLIDNVATAPRHRRRGLATAVVAAAVNASAERGNDTTFLFTREGSDAQRVYTRLGLAVLSRSAQFHLEGPLDG
jgi:ribosomal protein S18 acetylase RimI-like enzyme